MGYPKGRQRKPYDKSRIAELRRDGLTDREIAKILGVSRGTIWLARNEDKKDRYMPNRSRRFYEAAQLVSEIIAAIMKGLDAETIAVLHGVSVRKVNRIKNSIPEWWRDEMKHTKKH